MITDADLSAEVYSKIFTDIITKAGVSKKTLVDGKIQVRVKYLPEGGSYGTKSSTQKADDLTALAYTNKDHSKGALITAFVFDLGEHSDKFMTRSNVISILKEHEYKGHFQDNKIHNWNCHDEVYEYQMAQPTWSKVTEDLKEYLNKVIKENGYE